MLNVVEDDVELEQQDILTSEDSQDAVQQETFIAPAVVAEEEESAQTIFTVVEEMPDFPGGEGELMKFIAKSIKYPVIAQENGIQGRVVCTFVVNKDGSVVDAEVLRGVDPSLDKEALRVIGTMPKWKPGKQRGIFPIRYADRKRLPEDWPSAAQAACSLLTSLPVWRERIRSDRDLTVTGHPHSHLLP